MVAPQSTASGSKTGCRFAKFIPPRTFSILTKATAKIENTQTYTGIHRQQNKIVTEVENGRFPPVFSSRRVVIVMS
jgi:hypothetical protein